MVSRRLSVVILLHFANTIMLCRIFTYNALSRLHLECSVFFSGQGVGTYIS